MMTAERTTGSSKAIWAGAGAGLAVLLLLAFLAATSTTLFGARTDTVFVTSTATPQVISEVDSSLSQHLILFTSRNVSAIVSQYGTNANVTWEGIRCLAGVYPIVDKNSNFTLLLNTFFGDRYFQTLFVGNASRPVAVATAQSISANSTFDLAANGYDGSLTAVISAQDTYSYSATTQTWMISQETWHFLLYNSTGNVLNCA